MSYGTVGGQTAVGIQAAARTFFDKPARRLELHEAALLAGLPQAPSQYNPFENPGTAQVRRDQVLSAMFEENMISAAEAAEAKARPLGVKRNTYFTARRESYFFDYVKEELIREYGVQNVRKGGLKIRTTIDLKLQKSARAAIANRLNFAGAPSSAIVSIDPSNGYIRAMASSAKYAKSKFNLAAQGHRQPGSTFKVMVLMTFLKKHYDPDRTFYVSKPLQKGWLKEVPEYAPKTYDGSYGGAMNVTRGTLKSDNAVYAQLIADMGPEEVKETAREMGITSKLNGYYAEGLGGLEDGVSPLEMSNAYATIVSGGWRNTPIAITKVAFPDGRVEDFSKPKRTKVFEDAVTHKATQILRSNVTGGTGGAASGVCQAAGKTGTTDNFNDAWFVGFAPRLATAVWVGFPNAQVEMRNLYHGGPVAGGSFPTEIWADYMRVAVGTAGCGEYRQPTEPASFKPYFGKYAVTGTPQAFTQDAKDKKKKEEKEKRDRKRSGTDPYDPDLYESPPQQPPDTRDPPGDGDGTGRRRAARPIEPPDPSGGEAGGRFSRGWPRKRRSNSRARSWRRCRTRCSASASTTTTRCSGT